MGTVWPSIDPDQTFEKMAAKGIAADTITTLEHAGINLRGWLQRIESTPGSVRECVEAIKKAIKNHPVVPDSLLGHGLVVDPDTGRLDLVI